MRFEESPEPFISTPTPPPLPGGQPPQRRSSSPPEHRRPRRPESGDRSSGTDDRRGPRRGDGAAGEQQQPTAGDRPEPQRRPRRSDERRGDAASSGPRQRGDRERGEPQPRGPRSESDRRGRRGDGRRPMSPAPPAKAKAATTDKGPTDAPAPAPGAAPAKAVEATPAAPATGGFLEELGGELLASVSRSFYLTIRLLPEPLRGPISLGYLLARAMDTIADSPAESTPTETRLSHLRTLAEMIKYGTDAAALRPIQRDLAKRQKHAGERILLEKIDRCLTWLETLEPVADRWDLQRALTRIAHGQELDLVRFGGGTGKGEITALQTARELDDYTYFVAGSAGELWTRLCGRHLPDYATLPPEEMLRLGRRFGQGLQLVNVLRDTRGDLQQGRCYLPAEELVAAGIESPAALLRQPALADPILAHWRVAAAERLDDAWRYVRALRGKKLRYACALPVLLGIRTLALVAQTSPLTTEKPVKVSRANLRNIMFTAGVGMVAPALTDAYYKRARRQATAA